MKVHWGITISIKTMQKGTSHNLDLLLKKNIITQLSLDFLIFCRTIVERSWNLPPRGQVRRHWLLLLATPSSCIGRNPCCDPCRDPWEAGFIGFYDGLSLESPVISQTTTETLVVVYSISLQSCHSYPTGDIMRLPTTFARHLKESSPWYGWTKEKRCETPGQNTLQQ